MKKTAALILALVLLLGLCVSVSAAETNAGEEALERVIRGIREWKSEVDLKDVGLTMEEARSVLQEVFEHPDLFYFLKYTIWGDGDGDVTKVELYYRSAFKPADTEAFEAAVDTALGCLLPGMDDLQKALALHDYLAMHVAYDYADYQSGVILDAAYTAYGALVQGVAVCQGYSRAYQVLLERSGIPAVYVSSDTMDHGWNLVKLGDRWYHVDVTWDDPVPDRPGRAGHQFFLVSDTAMRDDAHRHRDWKTDLVCDDRSYDSGKLWTGLDQPIWFTDANTCWLLRETGDHAEQRVDLISRDWKTGREIIHYTVHDYWRVWGSDNSYWTDAYSGLVLWDNRLFFNDPLHIYAYDPSDGTCETVFTYTGGEGYIYGLASAGEEGVLWVLNTHPNKEGENKLLLPARKYASSDSANPFRDVKSADYFYGAVLWALENGVTKGVSKTEFGPQDPCIRGQVVTFLHRAMGAPEPASGENPFADVPEDAYYRNAVLWAVEQGITNGTGTDAKTGKQLFSPEEECTHAHILTFLWRTMTGKSASSYGVWYSEPLDWAMEKELLTGTATGRDQARVNDKAPRCDVVTYLWRALDQAA